MCRSLTSNVQLRNPSKIPKGIGRGFTLSLPSPRPGYKVPQSPPRASQDLHGSLGLEKARRQVVENTLYFAMSGFGKIVATGTGADKCGNRW